MQFIIEGLFAIRKAGFEASGFKAIKPELDLVEAGETQGGLVYCLTCVRRVRHRGGGFFGVLLDLGEGEALVV